MKKQKLYADKHQHGFSLVEMIVSVVIGLLVLSGALNVFLSGIKSSRANESAARMQENSRIAFELFSRDIREAGGNICGSVLISNAINNPTTQWWSDWSAGSVMGVASGSSSPLGSKATGAGTDSRIADTDAIIIRTATSDNKPVPIDYSTDPTYLQVTNIDNGYKPGDVLMACGGKNAIIFQKTNAANTARIDRTINAAITPGNCSNGGFDYVEPPTCPTTGDPSQIAGGYVSKLGAMYWYIANNGRNGRSLYRQTIESSNNTIIQPTTEMVEGVQSLRLRYLIEGLTTYLPADDVTFVNTPSNWQKVIAVQVELDTVSTEKTGSSASGENAVLARTITFITRLRNIGSQR